MTVRTCIAVLFLFLLIESKSAAGEFQLVPVTLSNPETGVTERTVLRLDVNTGATCRLVHIVVPTVDLTGQPITLNLYAWQPVEESVQDLVPFIPGVPDPEDS